MHIFIYPLALALALALASPSPPAAASSKFSLQFQSKAEHHSKMSTVLQDSLSSNIQMAEEEINNKHEDMIPEDEEEDDDQLKPQKEIVDVGPQFSLKEQLEKDQDDESLRKWKEQLLGSVDLSAIGESKDAEVKIVSLRIQCGGRADLVLPLPFGKKKTLFVLKEGSQYRLSFTFTVANNIVSGLKYTNAVWKTGVRVDHTKRMLGTFSPRKEPYVFKMEEESTPSGLFARGSYSARTKFVDDDGKCYLDVNYQFEIQKNWPTTPS